jgi:hypothetical protein
VVLRFADGGPVDADGTIDGTVVDPGALARLSSLRVDGCR